MKRNRNKFRRMLAAWRSCCVRSRRCGCGSKSRSPKCATTRPISPCARRRSCSPSISNRRRIRCAGWRRSLGVTKPVDHPRARHDGRAEAVVAPSRRAATSATCSSSERSRARFYRRAPRRCYHRQGGGTADLTARDHASACLSARPCRRASARRGRGRALRQRPAGAHRALPVADIVARRRGRMPA